MATHTFNSISIEYNAMQKTYMTDSDFLVAIWISRYYGVCNMSVWSVWKERILLV